MRVSQKQPKQMVRMLRYIGFHETRQFRPALIEGGAMKKPQQKRSVPRARIELATHGSSGHVPSDARNRAGTRARRRMVMSDNKLFNEGRRAGFSVLRSNDRRIRVTRWAADRQIDARQTHRRR